MPDQARWVVGSGLQAGDWYAYAVCDKSIIHSSSCYTAILGFAKASESGWTAGVTILPAPDEMQHDLCLLSEYEHALYEHAPCRHALYDRTWYDRNSQESSSSVASHRQANLTIVLDGSLQVRPHDVAGYEYGASLENILFAGDTALTHGTEYPLGISKIWDRGGNTARDSSCSFCLHSDVHGDAVLVTSADAAGSCAAVSGTAYTISHKNPYSEMRKIKVVQGIPFPIWGYVTEPSQSGAPAASLIYALMDYSGAASAGYNQVCASLSESYHTIRAENTVTANYTLYRMKELGAPAKDNAPNPVTDALLPDDKSIADLISEATGPKPENRSKISYEMRGGSVLGVYEYAETGSVVLAVDAHKGGSILIKIPRHAFEVVPKYVFLDGKPAHHILNVATDQYHIMLEFEHGAEEIEISSQARRQ